MHVLLVEANMQMCRINVDSLGKSIEVYRSLETSTEFYRTQQTFKELRRAFKNTTTALELYRIL